MNSRRVVVQGLIRPDGTLYVEQKLDLPTGPVNLTVEVASPGAAARDTWSVLEKIWAQRKALGVQPRSKTEIDAQIDAFRNEVETEFRETEKLYDDIRDKQD